MSLPPQHRHPRLDAQAVCGDDSLWACVLEPSPPAWHEEPFADDPAVPPPGVRSLTSTTAGDGTWDALVARRPDVAEFAAQHWLGAWRPLPAPPPQFAAARDALHRVAFYVLSGARRAVNGRIGLRWTSGGFGTPFFGDDMQVRVEGPYLVVQRAHGVLFEELTTLRRAGWLVDREPSADDRGEFDAPELGDIDAPLRVDDAHIAFLDAWFGFGASVLEQLRVDLAPQEPSRVQLWPEHFDLAIDAGERATFGCSPGDTNHAEPYLYVSAWNPVDRAVPYWNDPTFNGASLSLGALAEAGDQRARALAFFREGMAVSPAAPR
jgi:hypothetical protein